MLFVAALIRSALGFGEALVAVPLLALIIPIQLAAPLAVLISITVAAVVLAQDWRQVHIRSAASLLVATLLGAPAGLLLLTRVPGPAVKAVLALVIIAFSSYSLIAPKRPELNHDRWAWLFGLGAGVLGGAYGINGPPLVIYGALRGWSPQHLRATLQGYFLPASTVVMCGYWIAGLWTPEVTRYYLLALPAVVAAIFLGRAVNQRLHGRAYLAYVYLGLIAAGAALLLQAAF